jgi:hypothetical protein
VHARADRTPGAPVLVATVLVATGLVAAGLVATVLVATGTVASAAGASTTAAQTTPAGRTTSTAGEAPDSSAWQLAYLGSATSQLSSVTAISRSDAWAAGYFGKLYHPAKALVLRWNGAKWAAVRVPEPRALRAAGVAASSASDVWLFGGNNKILRWNGHKWLTMPSLSPVSESQPSYAPAQGAAVLSKSDVWLLDGVTDSGNRAVSTAVSHWNGHRWRTWSVPRIAGTGLSAVSATDAWLVGAKTLGIKEPLEASRWTGKSWVTVPMRHPDEYYYQPDVIMASPSDVWLSTDDAAARGQGLQRPSLILHWTRRGGWRESQPGPLAPTGSSGFVTDGGGGVWDGALADWTGTSWVAAAIGDSLLPYAGYEIGNLARIPGTTQLWGVGAAPAGSGTPTALVASYG